MNKYLIAKKVARREERARIKKYLNDTNIQNIKPDKHPLFAGKSNPLDVYAQKLQLILRIKADRRAHGRNYDRAKWLVNRHYDCFGMFVADIATARHFRRSGWACPSPDFIVR